MILSWLKKNKFGLLFTLLATLCMLFVFKDVLPTDWVTISPDMSKFWPNYWQSRSFQYFLAGTENFIPTNLLNLLGHPLWRRELFYMVCSVLAGLGVTFYLHTQRISKPAAYGAGLFFAFSGYSFTLFNAGHAGYFELIATGLFSFGLLARCFQRSRWVDFALLGATMIWSEIHQPDVWAIFIFLLVAYAIWLSVQTWRESRSFVFMKKVYPRFLLTLFVLLVIGGSQIYLALTDTLSGRKEQMGITSETTAEQTPEAKKKQEHDKWIFATNWSLPPEDIAEFAVPGIFGDCSFQRPTPYWGRLGRPEPFHPGQMMPNYRQHTVYLGCIVLMLALIGGIGYFSVRKMKPEEEIDSAPNYRDAPFWIGTAIVCTFFAMGRFTPVYKLFYSIPYMSFIRCPVKFHHLTELAVMILAGFGIDMLLRPYLSKIRKQGWIIAAACSGLALIGVFIVIISQSKMVANIKSIGFGPLADSLASYALSNMGRTLILLLLATAALFWLARTSSRKVIAGVIAGLVIISVADLSQVARRYIQPLHVKAHTQRNCVVDLLEKQAQGVPSTYVNYITQGDDTANWFATSLYTYGLINRSPYPGKTDQIKLLQGCQKDPIGYWKKIGARFVMLPLQQTASFVQAGAIKPLGAFILSKDGTIHPTRQATENAFSVSEIKDSTVPPVLYSNWICATNQTEPLIQLADLTSAVSAAPAPQNPVQAKPLPVQLEKIFGTPGVLTTSGKVKNPYSYPALLAIPVYWQKELVGSVDSADVPVYQTNDYWASLLVPPGEHEIKIHWVRRPFLPFLGLFVSLLVLGWGCMDLWKSNSKDNAKPVF